MKKLLLSITCLLTIQTLSFAQTFIVEDQSQVGGMTVRGDLLYVATTDNIKTIDLSQSNPQLNQAFNLDCDNLLFVGDILYIASPTRIRKLNMNFPSIITVLEDGLVGAYGLVENDGFLYFSECAGRKISRINIATDELEVLVDDSANPGHFNEILITGNTLYYLDAGGVNSLMALDLNNLSAGPQGIIYIPGNPIGMALQDNYLYITDYADIYRHYIGSEDLEIVNLNTSVFGQYMDVTFDNNNMYVSSFSFNDFESSIFTNTIPTSTLDAVSQKIDIFPNPTSDFLHLQDFEADELQIFDTQGKLIQTINQPTNKISVSHLTKGTYYLKATVDKQLFTQTVIIH